MPAARNHEVTVRRPLAKRMPVRMMGSLAAERFCSHLASSAKALVSKAGRCENGKVGSLARDFVSKSHRAQGAGIRPPTRDVHHPIALLCCPSRDAVWEPMPNEFPERTEEGSRGSFPR